jgi:predicted small secreted protein
LFVKYDGLLRESRKMVRKVLLLLALVGVVFSLLGCQTVQGLGEDIKWIGEKGAEIVDK